MSVVKRYVRRLFTLRTVEVEETVILWWGIFPWGATIGDYHAVTNLSAALTRRGHRHSILSHPDYGFQDHTAVEDLEKIKRNIKTIVFVCGPLTEHGKLTRFFADHPGARKIAVAVSVLKNQQSMNRRFDRILARDGQSPSYFDLAIAAVEEPVQPALDRRPVVGLCLRGNQSDHGKGVARFERAGEIFRSAIGRLDADVIEIDTVIRGTNKLPDIEAKFPAVDVMATTRLHGALFALAAGKPVFALDQIPGGAKVTAALEKAEWPHVSNVDAASEADVTAKLRMMVDELPAEAVRRSQKRILQLSRDTLETAADLIDQAAVRGTPANPMSMSRHP